MARMYAWWRIVIEIEQTCHFAPFVISTAGRNLKAMSSTASIRISPCGRNDNVGDGRSDNVWYSRNDNVGDARIDNVRVLHGLAEKLLGDRVSG